MASSFAFFSVFLFLLLAIPISAREAPGEKWKDVWMEEPMQKAIQGPTRSNSKSLTAKKTNCNHPSSRAENKNDFVKDFEPRPNISVYKNDVEPNEEKYMVKDFKPRPNISAYNDDAEPKESDTFAKDFDPRPNISVYND